MRKILSCFFILIIISIFSLSGLAIETQEYFFNVEDSIIVDGKLVTLINVDQGGVVYIEVSGVTGNIPTDSTKVINGIEIRNKETFYDSNNVSQRSATLIVYGNVEGVSSPISVIVGDTAPASDTLAAVDITNFIMKKYSVAPNQFLASEVGDITYNSMVVIGNLCTNKVFKTIIGRVGDENDPAYCVALFSEGEGWIQFSKTDNGKGQILVGGCTAIDTRKAAHLLAKGGYFSVSGNDIILGDYDFIRVGGTIDNPVVLPSNAPKKPCLVSEEDYPPCIDSDDGKNYYEKGFINGNFKGSFDFKDSDFCSLYVPETGNEIRVESCGVLPENHCNVREYYCAGDVNVGLTPYTCTNGCMDGACNIIEKVPGVPGPRNEYLLYVGESLDIGGGIILTLHNVNKEGTIIKLDVNGIITLNCIKYKACEVIGGIPAEKGLIITDIEKIRYGEAFYDPDVSKSWAKVILEDGAILVPILIEPGEPPEKIPIPPLPPEKTPIPCKINGICEPEYGEDKITCLEDCGEIRIPIQCNGCLDNGNCLNFGMRLIQEEIPVYCDFDKFFSLQKEAEEECQNNFECGSNLCIASKCVSPGLWQKFIDWFARVFGYVVKT